MFISPKYDAELTPTCHRSGRRKGCFENRQFLSETRTLKSYPNWSVLLRISSHILSILILCSSSFTYFLIQSPQSQNQHLRLEAHISNRGIRIDCVSWSRPCLKSQRDHQRSRCNLSETKQQRQELCQVRYGRYPAPTRSPCPETGEYLLHSPFPGRCGRCGRCCSIVDGIVTSVLRSSIGTRLAWWPIWPFWPIWHGPTSLPSWGHLLDPTKHEQFICNQRTNHSYIYISQSNNPTLSESKKMRWIFQQGKQM